MPQGRVTETKRKETVCRKLTIENTFNHSATVVLFVLSLSFSIHSLDVFWILTYFFSSSFPIPPSPILLCKYHDSITYIKYRNRIKLKTLIPLNSMRQEDNKSKITNKSCQERRKIHIHKSIGSKQLNVLHQLVSQRTVTRMSERKKITHSKKFVLQCDIWLVFMPQTIWHWWFRHYVVIFCCCRAHNLRMFVSIIQIESLK